LIDEIGTIANTVTAEKRNKCLIEPSCIRALFG
jgi:hypothetical protein